MYNKTAFLVLVKLNCFLSTQVVHGQISQLVLAVEQWIYCVKIAHFSFLIITDIMYYLFVK